MGDMTFEQLVDRTSNKVQALLQQLMAHRGEPQAVAGLEDHASQTLSELFELTLEAQRERHDASGIEEAKQTLCRHFPRLLETNSEHWVSH